MLFTHDHATWELDNEYEHTSVGITHDEMIDQVWLLLDRTASLLSHLTGNNEPIPEFDFATLGTEPVPDAWN